MEHGGIVARRYPGRDADLFAYLDAGSASAIVSMILGGVAAIGVAVRYRWNQLLRP